jgi:hypothetical protein
VGVNDKREISQFCLVPIGRFRKLFDASFQETFSEDEIIPFVHEHHV